VSRLRAQALFVTLPLLYEPALAVAQRRAEFLALPSDSRTSIQQVYRPTYWVEGATIGAAIVGTTAAWIAYELGCEFSDVQSDCNASRIVASGAVGSLVGGIAGGLIGGAFSAPKSHPLRGHPVRSTAIGAVAGSLWSFGLFWQFCLNGCRSEEVVLGVSTTGVGALAGLLVGR
jgi:hypothetical protein